MDKCSECGRPLQLDEISDLCRECLEAQLETHGEDYLTGYVLEDDGE